MTTTEITEAYLRIGIKNGWNLEQWYRDNIAPIIICPCRENSLIKEVASILIDSKLYKLLFTDIPFAKAVWGKQKHSWDKNPPYICYYCGVLHSLRQTEFCWQYKLQQLIVQLPEKWWEWLEESLPNFIQDQHL